MARDPNLAVLFPGQGSQAADMRARVERERPALLALALEELGDDPFARTGEGTRWQQPVVYCAALAGWSRLRPGLEPGALAGHSLGELAALAAAGALHEEDGLRLVAARARLMQGAADADDGGMLAALGDDRPTVAAVARGHGLTVAGDNAPAQLVLSGPAAALDAAGLELGRRGLRSHRLPVGGAFHSPAMAPAVAPFRAALERVEIRPPALPVLSCVTAEPFDGDVRERLAEALVRPVRWLDVLRALRARGATRYVETGPGRVLTGLVRRSLDGARAEAPLDMGRVGGAPAAAAAAGDAPLGAGRG